MKKIYAHLIFLSFSIAIFYCLFQVFTLYITRPPQKEKYEIVWNRPYHQFDGRSLVVRIHDRFSKDQLEQVAKTIKRKQKHFEWLQVFYYLNNSPENSPAWAVSFSSPNNKLIIQINGATKEEMQTLSEIKAPATASKVLGRWINDRTFGESSTVIFLEKQKYYLKKCSLNKVERTMELLPEKEDKIKRYYIKNDCLKSYIILDKDGSISWYDKFGKIRVDHKIY